MNLRPDRQRTWTGYAWLDRLLSPIQSVIIWHQRRRLFKLIGQGDREKGRALLVEALQERG